ncbi:hypothetical protein JTB14_002512 [Gonioctena quinquepunctata]|nr:hypothetical protein JTB14_002512 [Gonioctena quinquepunctata]
MQGQPHVIQSVLNNVIKQPLYQTIYGNLTFKPPRPRVPNTGAESSLIRPFHCALCDARFTRKVNLNRHLRYHAGDRQYKCHLCPKTFITSYRLKEHLNYHNNIKKYGCKVCNKRFVTSTLLKRHMIIHSTTKAYMCPYCSKRFKTLLLSRQHIQVVHRKDVLPKYLANGLVDSACVKPSAAVPQNQTGVIADLSSCNEENTSIEQMNSEALVIQNVVPSQSISNNMLDHKYEIIEEVDYRTIYMNMEDLQFIENSSLNMNTTVTSPIKLQNVENSSESVEMENVNGVYINSNTENGIINIIIPPKQNKEGTSHHTYNNSVYTMNGLHLSLNSPEAIFDGNTVFQTSSDLGETRNIYDDANIICMICNGVFSSFVTFQKHTCEKKTANVERSTDLSNETEKTPECEELGKEENRKRTECSICQKILPTKSALLKHVKEHSESINFECGICKVSINGKTTYLKHMTSHRGVNKCHTCEDCFKSFKKASDLKRHLRIHSGEKPFGCHICDRKFSLKATLLSHIRTHDPNHKEFNCIICNSFYSSKASLQIHMSLHTGQKPHSCSFCNMKFRTIGNKKSHEALKHSSKKNSRSAPKNKITDVLESVSSQISVIDCPCDSESQTISTSEGGLMENDDKGHDGELQSNIPSQIISLAVEPDGMLMAAPEDQEPILYLQLEMSDIVLTNENDGVNSLILNEVELLDLNAASSNLKIISLPQTDVESGVTISINEFNKELKKQENRRVKCDICNKMYSSKDVLRKHRKNVHGEIPKLSCGKCLMKFKSKVILDKHLKTHSNEEGSTNSANEKSPEAPIERVQQAKTSKDASTLLNIKFDLPSGTIEDPLFNSLFAIKKT